MSFENYYSSSLIDSRDLLYVGFNQDHDCFAVGLNNGFRIYSCDPVKEKARKEFEDGGIRIVEMLFRSNYLAIVGGGKNPRYSPNKVVIWDDLKGKGIIELEFRSEVKNVKLRGDRIVVVLENRIFVYTLCATPQKLQVYETADNAKGLVALSSSQEFSILAFPGKKLGHLQVVDLNAVAPPLDPTSLPDYLTDQTFPGADLGYSTINRYATTSLCSMPTQPKSHTIRRYSKPSSHPTNIACGSTSNMSIIAAHTTALSVMAISPDGAKIATASIKGTLIRVFDSSSGMLLNELRRGFDRAEIYSIAFSRDGARLCVSSDKGTVHIFNLEFECTARSNTLAYYRMLHIRELVTYPAATGNRLSSLSFMKELLPKYFSSEWSFAHFHMATEGRWICGFGPEENTVIAVCADGSSCKISFDLHQGGECERESHVRFLDWE
ncbi:WD40 repeat-like protein [Basidiobolus meristosporus CBS 931.73]|uniref:WD40 repeat-like protein n=1 Tax=Basidiobolus meristosporus CBS 931.73 TaxID=1314790 RepID=A0A1Y1Z4C4_9FUNG|nr:WD40 repeat-like protein [Basidiobolus meristosporus CBS 931.73]|eukprot:ORY05100.1 WD40 repeat-like protein [Basidiobolus meristosporus CBS 931.73]